MEEPVSKSQNKRQAQALQALGVELVSLSLAKLNTLPLSENLYKAIIDAKSIKSHGAKRRQAQLIGKLIRADDFEAIRAAYQEMLDEDSAVTVGFHEVELWRDKLIQGGKVALTEFINIYKPDEIQQLQQMIKKAMQDELKQKNTGAAKALFRYLRVFIK
ncbi:MAG: DUF615 domain-containing protein [Legionella sp.]|nr:DUF615 domain-containing protein [Legionella sp.]